jgi:hypothetical protein
MDDGVGKANVLIWKARVSLQTKVRDQCGGSGVLACEV